MLRAILFDLDGTLLDIDISDFLARYFSALREVLEATSPSSDPDAGMAGILEATRAMSLPHDGRTNQEVFHEEFLALSGIDLDEEWEAFSRFYEEVFPRLRGDIGPVAGALRAVECASGLGLHVAVATNPIFPLRAIEHRIDWAGLGDVDFALVTSYENMRATKPHAAYYRQIAETLGVDTSECLMVGDDPILDLAAADVGMRTYYVGTAPAEADFTGDLSALCDLLPRLADPGSTPTAF